MDNDGSDQLNRISDRNIVYSHNEENKLIHFSHRNQ